MKKLLLLTAVLFTGLASAVQSPSYWLVKQNPIYGKPATWTQATLAEVEKFNETLKGKALCESVSELWHPITKQKCTKACYSPYAVCR